MQPDSSLGIGVRSHVKLDWGANFYTCEKLRLLHNDIQKAYEQTMNQCDKKKISNDGSEWNRIACAAMTSMVVSLDFVRVTGEVINVHYSYWEQSHFNEVLNALETSYWHARSFNENDGLRRQLRRMSFMKFSDDSAKLPHLLDQEIQTATLILDVLLKMYSKADGRFFEFSTRRLERFLLFNFSRALFKMHNLL